MKVKELIETLVNLNPEAHVIASGDDEGNYFRCITQISVNNCDLSGYRPEIGLDCLTDEDIANGYTQEDVLDGEPAIVLW